MNLEQARSMAELKMPLPVTRTTGIRKSRVAVARRVFQLAAAGGHPYKNHTPESWAKKWLKSKEFVLMEIDINAAACIHQPAHQEGVSHYFQCSTDAMDPIVVDGNKRQMGRTALGYIPEVVVHDGKHRLKAQRMQGHVRIMAWVGKKVVDKLQKRGAIEINASAFKKYKKTGIVPTLNKAEVTYELYASTIPATGLKDSVTKQSSGEAGSRPKAGLTAGGPGSGRHKWSQSKVTGEHLYKSAGYARGYSGGTYGRISPPWKKDGQFTVKTFGPTGFEKQAKTLEEAKKMVEEHIAKQDAAKGLNAMGGGGAAGGTSGSGGSGSNPLRMGVMAKKKVQANGKDCNACGARSTGSLNQSEADDTNVDDLDKKKTWNPDKPNNFAPGTGKGYTKRFGTPNGTIPGSANNIGPRVLNKGASKSDFSREVNAMGHEVDCVCAMCVKSKKNMDASGLKVKSINMKAPPGREDQVKELKKKYGEDSPIPFQIAWDQHQKGKN